MNWTKKKQKASVELDFVSPLSWNTVERAPAPTLQDFSIGGHCLRLGAKGIIDLELVSRVEEAFYNHEDAAIDHTSPGSLTVFNHFSPSSIVLGSLRDFASRDLAPKNQFKWGEGAFRNFTRALKDICHSLISIYRQEPRLVPVQSPVYILGDLHGNFQDLCTFEKLFWNMGLHLSPASLLFLGDYVDRGEFGVEVVGYLFALKLRNPKRMHIIRGNHEIRETQRNFTFYLECMKKFANEGNEMWNLINDVFDHLPLAAVVDEKIFCCHGGIPPPWLCPTIRVINRIPCPLVKMNEESPLAWELVWNDPLKEGENVSRDNLASQLSINEGFAINVKRGTGHAFSTQALINFLKINNLSYVVRAHEAQKAGFQLNLKNKLLTVFSSSHYNRGTNDAACILVQDRKLRIFRIDTSENVYPY